MTFELSPECCERAMLRLGKGRGEWALFGHVKFVVVVRHETQSCPGGCLHLGAH